MGVIVGAWTGGALANDWEARPWKWDFSNPWTYVGIGAGGALGYAVGGHFAGGYGIKLTLAAFGIPFLGGGGNDDQDAESTETSTELAIESTYVYGYEGINITVVTGVGFDDDFYRYDFLPDGSLFRNPRYGTILNANAEDFIYRAGGADPGYFDPIDLVDFFVPSSAAGTFFKPGRIRSFRNFFRNPKIVRQGFKAKAAVNLFHIEEKTVEVTLRTTEGLKTAIPHGLFSIIYGQGDIITGATVRVPESVAKKLIKQGKAFY